MESAAEGLLDKARTADADCGSGPAGWGAWGKGLQWPPDILAQGRNSRMVALGVEREALQVGLAGYVRGWQDG